ncbi:coq1 putative hexaprenyl diphosphate synthase [Podochytrium sp. JEL0797]|nr:coq1 putative hexaprenyl diphosphate synthase [Podochytrium sp. JEL0797]
MSKISQVVAVLLLAALSVQASLVAKVIVLGRDGVQVSSATTTLPKSLSTTTRVGDEEILGLGIVGASANQVFAHFRHSSLPTIEASFPVEGSTKKQLSIDLAKKSTFSYSTFRRFPGTYELSLVSLEFPEGVRVGTVDFDVREVAEAAVLGSTEAFAAQKEIYHVFREQEKMPNAMISVVFAAAVVVVPWVMLIAMWTSIGANVSNLSASPSNQFWGPAFLLSLAASCAFFVVYWVQLNLFELFGYGSVVWSVMGLLGRQALVSRADARLKDEKRVVDANGDHKLSATSLVGADVALLAQNIRGLLGSDHPVLKSVASYYFMGTGGKHIRPMLVLLVAQASSVTVTTKQAPPLSVNAINAPVSSHCDIHFSPPTTPQSTPNILPTQRRLAEITEMIHTASLLHDDVIDASLHRRAQPSVNAEYGNKMAILAGDFLLSRASVALARLRNLEVVELLSTVIANLVEGEFMQLRNSSKARDPSQGIAEAKGEDAGDLVIPRKLAPLNAVSYHPFGDETSTARFEYYLLKTYMKTASLIANSCRASAVLGGCDGVVADAVYRYGRALGLSFQIVDDLLDFTVTADEMGKPVNADLKLGIATAPVLYAVEEFAELDAVVERGFKQEGDAALALKLVHASAGIERTRQLAAAFCAEAVDALQPLPDSDAKRVLIQLTEAVLTRKH